MKNFKSLGHINGYSSEFFKFLWGAFIMRAINNSNILLHFQNQISQKLLLACRMLENKNISLKNQRSIRLLCVVYKMSPGCIANRIQSFLDKLINKNQTGFIKGSLFEEI